MKRLSRNELEVMADKLRKAFGLNNTEPVHIKTVLRKANIMTSYLPLSPNMSGLSIKHKDYKFILVNSNLTRARQHYTIAHELFHLYYDDSPKPHFCKDSDPTEFNADKFACYFLMPKMGIIEEVLKNGGEGKKITMATILRLEQLYSVSHQSLLITLLDLQLISKEQYKTFSSVSIKETARLYGYDTSLYEKGNENLHLGDYGEKSRLLFEQGLISEGHYLELLNLISDEED